MGSPRIQTYERKQSQPCEETLLLKVPSINATLTFSCELEDKHTGAHRSDLECDGKAVSITWRKRRG